MVSVLLSAAAAPALAAPDLVATGITAPASGTTQQLLSASWTVEDQGADDATGGWRDHLWLSSDAVLGDDTDLGFVDRGSLAAGASYTATLDTTVPNVAAGDYFLIVQVDSLDAVAEDSESNNTFAVPFHVDQPDLVPTAITAPSAAAARQSITVSWTVENQGGGPTTGTSRDRLWFSTGGTIGGDIDLGFVDHGAVAAGASYVATLDKTLPDVSAGTYYLIVQSDVLDSVFEASETNNTFGRAIQVTVCGDGAVAGDEACDAGAANGTPTSCCTSTCQVVAVGRPCRPAADACDAAESCDGVSPSCPADAMKPSGTTCRAASDVCDLPAVCDGASAACPPNPFEPSTTLCRAAAGACDVDDYCTGSSAACVDRKQSFTHVCRSAAGVCDAVETCDGLTTACPPDAFLGSAVVCRPSTQACDVPERCTGTGPACPPDTGLPDGDGDGTCDAQDDCPSDYDPAQTDSDGDGIGDVCDPCTNGAIATKQKLAALKLQPPVGDEKLSIKGEAVLPTTPSIDPVAHGARVLLTSHTGATLLDVTVPAGGYDATLRSGWKVNGTKTVWTFDALGLSTAGITKVGIRIAPNVRGGIKFDVKGRNGIYPIGPDDVPVTATLVVDAPMARAGQCAIVQFPDVPPAHPSCTLVALGSTLKCK